jgi:hypothetical protein
MTSLTTVLSVYGAIVGTGGLAVSIALARRDRARIQVFAGPDDPARAEVKSSSQSAPRFLIHARNRGRRAVAIERVWYTRKSTGPVRHLLTDHYDMGSQVLAEGEGLIWEMPFQSTTPDDLDCIVLEARDGGHGKGLSTCAQRQFVGIAGSRVSMHIRN